MKFVKLHSTVDNSPFYINMENVEKMEWTFKPQLQQTAYSSAVEMNKYTKIKMRNDVVYYCVETPEEIIQKIAETEQRERSFMNEWKREVDDQLSRLTVKKDGVTDATDRW